MIKNYLEAFEKTRIAGAIAAGALDEVAKRTDVLYQHVRGHTDDLWNDRVDVGAKHAARTGDTKVPINPGSGQ